MPEPVRVCGVYLLVHTFTMRVYVGKSVNVHRRIEEHLRCHRGGRDMVISRAIRKYGRAEFLGFLLETCETEALAFERERWWIKALDTCGTGFNVAPGGLGSDSATATARMLDLSRRRTPEERSELSRKASASMSSAARMERAHKMHAGRDWEAHGENLRQLNARRTAKERAASTLKGMAGKSAAELREIALKGKRTMTPERCRIAGLKRAAGMTPERRAAIAKKGWLTRRAAKASSPTAPAVKPPATPQGQSNDSQASQGTKPLP